MVGGTSHLGQRKRRLGELPDDQTRRIRCPDSFKWASIVVACTHEHVLVPGQLRPTTLRVNRRRLMEVARLSNSWP